MAPRYEVIECRVWKSTDGRSASIYSACPWSSEADKANWSIVCVGYTLRDNDRGTEGIGRQPSKTREEADALCAQLNKLRTRQER